MTPYYAFNYTEHNLFLSAILPIPCNSKQNLLFPEDKPSTTGRIRNRSVPAPPEVRNRTAPPAPPPEESSKGAADGDDAPKRSTRSTRSKGKLPRHSLNFIYYSKYFPPFWTFSSNILKNYTNSSVSLKVLIH